MSKSNLPNSVRSSENVAEINMMKDIVPPSYVFGTTMKTSVPAQINLLRVDGNFPPIPDIHHEFKSRIDLERSPPFYRLFIFPSMAKKHHTIDMERLRKVEMWSKEKNTLILTFDNFELMIQFRYTQKFEFCYRVISKILGIIEVSKNKKPPRKMEKYEFRPIVTTYEVKTEGSKVPKSFRSLSGVSRVDSSSNLQFFQKNSENWGPNDFFNFLKHVLIQPEGKNEIMTVHEYIEAKGIFESMEDYFLNNEEHTVYTLFQRIRNLDRKEDMRKLHAFQQSVCQDEELLEILQNEFVKLRSNRPNHLFDIHYYLILKKRVDMLGEYLEVGQIRLKDVQHELVYYTSYRYSVSECRNHLLSMLLHEKGFDQYVDDLYVKFTAKEQETFKDCFKASEYDPVHWEQMLKTFNEENNVKMESVCYEVNLQKKNNDIRYKKLNCDKALETMAGKVEEMEAKIKAKKDEAEEVLEKLMDLMDDDDESGEGDEYSKLEERSSELDQEQIQLGIKKKELVMRFENQKAQKKNFKLWDREINVDSREKMKQNYHKCIFNSKLMRKRELEKTLLSQVLEGRAGQGIQELGVKLVISILTDHEPERWQMEVVRKLDKFTKFSFYKWGFLHANIQIMNIGLHWFSDSLVKITNHAVGRNYEEIAAFDVFCPLILNPNTIFDTITKLAENIVSVNVNMKYNYHNVWNKTGTLNCQEFCQLILSKLGAPSSGYPEVQAYMDEVKDLLAKMSTQTSKDLRFIKVFPSGGKKKKKGGGDEADFYEKFKKVFEGDIRYKPDKKGKVYFNTHEELDRFYDELCIVDVKFESNHPGYFELLKGFDRAFWMRALKESVGGEEALPGAQNCPFCFQQEGGGSNISLQ